MIQTKVSFQVRSCPKKRRRITAFSRAPFEEINKNLKKKLKQRQLLLLNEFLH